MPILCYQVDINNKGIVAKMVTIKDIARETGLGIATISKYLNGGTVREKNKIAIETAIDQLGFTLNELARGFKTGKSYTIGVIIPELSNIFITSIITIIEDILRKNGYGVIICDCRTDNDQECEAMRFLIRKRVDGIINMPVSKDGKHLMPAIENGIPIVLIDRMIPNLQDDVNAVLVDNVSASASAVTTLFEAGHKNIGIILGPQDVFTSQQRLLGYNQVLIQNQMQPEISRIVFSDYTVQGGYESMKKLLLDSEVTAVFVTNYEMTLGAIIAINELGISIPEQISFIGFDNLHFSSVIQPKLTIVTQPLEEIGQNAAEILLSKLTKDESEIGARVITLSTGMIPGDSVKSL